MSVGSVTAQAFANLNVTVDLGGTGSVINASSTINATGSGTSDADSSATGTSGGLVKVSSYTSIATITPTINVNVGDADVTAGNVINISAVHNLPPTPSS